jgi:hypothetical protein
MLVRQFLALVILYGAVVVDVKKIPRHPDKMPKLALGSQGAGLHWSVTGDSATFPALVSVGYHPQAEVERTAMSTRRRFKQVPPSKIVSFRSRELAETS